jgi:nitroreductase
MPGTWDAIRARRNVQEFTDQPLSEREPARILEAGWRAPSSRNWQPWDYVVVSTREQLREFSEVGRGGR